MNLKNLLMLCFAIALTGCASWPLPKTPGDPQNAPSYGYHPIDPLPVRIKGEGVITTKRVLDSLPDETMRIAIGQVQGNGGITFGPAKAGVAGNSYVVILDYIKFETKSFGVDITDSAGKRTANLSASKAPPVIVPVYVGVGLRLSANVTVNEGSVDLGNLFALGVAAQAKQVSGTMVVQTLGISGESVSSIIPMPSEINASTIQAALVSLGAIKAKMYDQGTEVNPRVVGVYNNLGGGQETINGFISSLLQEPQFLEVKTVAAPQR
jgi:hypothetical protein